MSFPHICLSQLNIWSTNW